MRRFQFFKRKKIVTAGTKPFGGELNFFLLTVSFFIFCGRLRVALKFIFSKIDLLEKKGKIC